MPPHQASKSSKKKKQKKNRQHEVGCGSVMSSKNSGNRFPIVKKKKTVKSQQCHQFGKSAMTVVKTRGIPCFPSSKKKTCQTTVASFKTSEYGFPTGQSSNHKPPSFISNTSQDHESQLYHFLFYHFLFFTTIVINF